MLKRKWPEVKRFAGAAEQHWEAAKVLYSQCPPTSVTRLATEAVYLGGYVVECLLKALILSNTPLKGHEEMVARLKKEAGHNLDLLRDLLNEESGMKFPSRQIENLRRVSGWRSEMRYVPKSTEAADAKDFLKAVAGLRAWITGEREDAID
jgi:hypothetical protein